MSKPEDLTALAFRQGQRQAENLVHRIGEIAVALAPEYPGIANADPWEQLWAIEQTYKGTEAANRDLHKLLDWMGEELGWSPLEVVEFSERKQATEKGE